MTEEELDGLSTLRLQVREFHRAFGLHSNDCPTKLPDDVVRLCLRLIAEEFFELVEATMDLRYGGANDGIQNAKDRVMFVLKETTECPPIPVRCWENLPEVVDALGDLDYVSESMRDRMGVNGSPIAAEIQRTNMSKLGPDGKPIIVEGKIRKPMGWTPPDLEAELHAQGWRP